MRLTSSPGNHPSLTEEIRPNIFMTQSFQRRFEGMSPSEVVEARKALARFNSKIEQLGYGLLHTNTKVLAGHVGLQRHAVGAYRIIYRQISDESGHRGVLIEDILLRHDYERLHSKQEVDPPESWVPMRLSLGGTTQTTPQHTPPALNLSEAQEEIFLHQAGRLVRGGAGSGKTLIAERLLKARMTGDRAVYVAESPRLVAYMKGLLQGRDRDAITCLTVRELAEKGIASHQKLLGIREFSEWWRQNQQVIRAPALAYVELLSIDESVRNNPNYSRDDYRLEGKRKTLVPQRDRDQFFLRYERFLEYLESKDLVCLHRMSTPPDEYLEAFDMVLCDECQVLSPSLIRMVLQMTKKTGSPWFLGDEAQSHFGLRGIMEQIPLLARSHGHELEESVLKEDYRNPEEIVALKNTLTSLLLSLGLPGVGSETLLDPKSGRKSGVYYWKATGGDVQTLLSRHKYDASCVVLVPDVETKAKNPLSPILALTPEQALGLEWKTVLLFGFLTKYGQTLQQGYDSLSPTKKDEISRQEVKGHKSARFTEDAAHLRQILSHLIIAVSRTQGELHFIEPGKQAFIPSFLSSHFVTSSSLSTKTPQQSTREEFMALSDALRDQGLTAEAELIAKRAAAAPRSSINAQTPKTADDFLTLLGIERSNQHQQSPTSSDNSLQLLEGVASVANSGLLKAYLEATAGKRFPDYHWQNAAQTFYQEHGISADMVGRALTSGTPVRSLLGESALLVACHLGEVSLVKKALNSSHSKDALSMTGETPSQCALARLYESTRANKRRDYQECALLTARDSVEFQGEEVHLELCPSESSLSEAAYWYLEHAFVLARRRAKLQEISAEDRADYVASFIVDTFDLMHSCSYFAEMATLLKDMGELDVQEEERRMLFDSLLKISASLIASSESSALLRQKIGPHWVEVRYLTSGVPLPELLSLSTDQEAKEESINEVLRSSEEQISRALQKAYSLPKAQITFSQEKLINFFSPLLAHHLEEQGALLTKSDRDLLRLTLFQHTKAIKEGGKKLASLFEQTGIAGSLGISAMVADSERVVEAELNQFWQGKASHMLMLVSDGNIALDFFKVVKRPKDLFIPTTPPYFYRINNPVLSAIAQRDSNTFKEFDSTLIEKAREELKESPIILALAKVFNKEHLWSSPHEALGNTEVTQASKMHLVEVLQKYFPSSIETLHTINVKLDAISTLVDRRGFQIERRNEGVWRGWLPRKMALDVSYEYGVPLCACADIHTKDLREELPVAVRYGVLLIAKPTSLYW